MVIASFVNVVAGTFASLGITTGNKTTAMASVLFIVLAVIYGMLTNRGGMKTSTRMNRKSAKANNRAMALQSPIRLAPDRGLVRFSGNCPSPAVNSASGTVGKSWNFGRLDSCKWARFLS